MPIPGDARELIYERHRRLTKKKPGPTARARAKRRRKEAPVAAKVRAACVERDGYCRVETAGYGGMVAEEPIYDDVLRDLRDAHRCDGLSEWAHFGEQKRARTRGMRPEQRHTTAGSLMLCRFHHQAYDAGRFPIVARTRDGANGPLTLGGTE